MRCVQDCPQKDALTQSACAVFQKAAYSAILQASMLEKDWGAIGSHAPAAPNLLDNEPEDEHVKPRKKRLLLIAVFLLTIALAGIIARAMAPPKQNDNPMAYDPITLEPKPPTGLINRLSHLVFSRELHLKGERDDRINLLILGIGGAGHEGPELTDTIMIASIKPSTRQLALVSIPRDLAVDIPKIGEGKINAVNAYGEMEKPGWGAGAATEVVSGAFGIKIPYYIRIDFRAFAEIIDTLGGIAVNIETSFTDPMYPDRNFGYKTVSFAKGAAHMDGKAALEFARSRHGSSGEGSDFARAKRQQKVILALKEKIIESATAESPLQLKAIMDSLDAHMTTNMSFAELLALLKIGRMLDTNSIQTLTLDTSPNGYLQADTSSAGAFVLAPAAGDFTEISRAIDNIFADAAVAQKNDTPTQKPAAGLAFVASAIEIQNGTWRAGLAARMKKRLEDRGFMIATIGNSAERPQGASGIYIISDSADVATPEALKNELHIPIRRQLPPNIIPETGTKIFVLLGEDMEE